MIRENRICLDPNFHQLWDAAFESELKWEIPDIGEETK